MHGARPRRLAFKAPATPRLFRLRGTIRTRARPKSQAYFFTLMQIPARVPFILTPRIFITSRNRVTKLTAAGYCATFVSPC